MRSQAEIEDAGEGYFASISDLMVGILFIFLLMLAVFAINYATEDKDKTIDELRRQITELTIERDYLRELLAQKDAELVALSRDLAQVSADRDRLREGLTALIRELEGVSIGLQDDQGSLERVRSELLFSLQKDLERKGVRVEVDAGQGILRLSSEGLFELDQARFTSSGLAEAKALIDEMGRLLPCYSKADQAPLICKNQPIFETVLIEGHTDTRRSNMEGGNWKLSTDRARAFLDLMAQSGSLLDQLKNDNDQLLLGLAGYGESRPLPHIDGTDHRNRRIEIRFLLSADRESLAKRIQGLDELVRNLRSLAAPTP